MKAGIYTDIPNNVYHNEIEALSRGGVMDILRSPAHYQEAKKTHKSSKALEFGSAFHEHILEPDKLMMSLQFPRHATGVQKKGRKFMLNFAKHHQVKQLLRQMISQRLKQ